MLDVAFERRLARVSQKLYGNLMFLVDQKRAFQTLMLHAVIYAMSATLFDMCGS